MQKMLTTHREFLGMTVKYACIFGISSAVPELKIGHLHLSVYDGISFIIAPGIKGRLSWFIVLKLDRIYQYGSAPRFSLTDAASQCEKMADLYIWDDVQFAQLWQCREAFSMTALEENIFQTWHCGRIVCIGDSMHKVSSICYWKKTTTLFLTISYLDDANSRARCQLCY
jgi:hypothetical protein